MSNFEQQAINLASRADAMTTEHDRSLFDRICRNEGLPPAKRARLREAIDSGYLPMGSREGYPLYNAFWRWCRAKARPFLVVTRSRKYSRITLDLLPARAELPSGKAMGAVVRAVRERVEGGERATYRPNLVRLDFRGIPSECVERAAQGALAAVLDQLVTTTDWVLHWPPLAGDAMTRAHKRGQIPEPVDSGSQSRSSD